MYSSCDVIVIGRGLAGAVLVEELLGRGLSVRVFDAPRERTASQVAAGLVNPVVLRMLVLSWRAPALLERAAFFYTRSNAHYGHLFWRPADLVKVFATADEEKHWVRRMTDQDVTGYIDRKPVEDVDASNMVRPFGYGHVVNASQLDVRRMLAAQRERLLAAGILVGTEVREDDIVEADDVVRVGDTTAPIAVHCAGPFTSKLAGLVPVKGEGITVRIPDLQLGTIVHRGIFLQPVEEDVFRVGATFNWDDVWAGPTQEARHWLLEKLRLIVDRDVEVLDHWAGVRPTSRDRRPILGRLAASPRQAVFNGLGSRGVLQAPWCAMHLCDHLFNGAPLAREVDASRFGG